jgi:hypothetical protein
MTERFLKIGDCEPVIPLVLLFLLAALLLNPEVVVIRKVEPFVLVLFTELLLESTLRPLKMLI